MSRLSRACFLLAAFSLAAYGSVRAQEGPETVNIPTADGVKLRGAFYPAAKKCLATVIMLHPIGEGKSMKAPEWKALAESLQKAGYSVLMFDFRGHGESTNIDDEKAFWGARVGSNYPNQANVKTKAKDTIEVKDYIKQSGAYLPVLVNDIAAARAYLERRNDNTKDCNTSSIIVVGVDQGATLGAIWINSEWSRYKGTPSGNPMFPKWTLENRPEGNDIIGAVFLTPSPSLSDSRTVSLSAILKTACKDHGMAAAFFVGSEDKKNFELAKTLQKNLQVPKSKKHEIIGPAELKGTNLTGMKLLTKGLKTDEGVVKYLELFVEDRRTDWAEREFDKSYYFWRPSGGGTPVTAHKKGDKTLVFEDYGKFIAK